MIHESLANVLSSAGVRLDTDLGQHFLIDDDVLHAIVDAANIHPGDRIIEIGPGIGVLTRALLQRQADVTAVELDHRLPPLLWRYVAAGRDTTNDRLHLIEGNALHAKLTPVMPYAVVANIPYHITSPLLHRLLLELPRPQSLTLLVQREVAEAICAEGTGSMLALLVHLSGTASMIRIVPPAAFLPPPMVDSAVLRIVCHTQPLVSVERLRTILRIAKHAMSQRRKMLRGSMKSLPGGIEALCKAEIDGTRRPESLQTEEWIRLTDALRPTA